VALTDNGERLISCHDDGLLTVWDLEAAEPVLFLDGHGKSPTSLAATPRGDMAISGDWAGTVICWDIRAEESMVLKQSDGTAITATAISSDGSTGSSSADRTITVWDLRTKDAICAFTIDEQVTVCACTSDLVAVGDRKGGIHVFSIDRLTPSER
jgi:WD40 repeat protein